jgi:hypothetical protein
MVMTSSWRSAAKVSRQHAGLEELAEHREGLHHARLVGQEAQSLIDERRIVGERERHHVDVADALDREAVDLRASARV